MTVLTFYTWSLDYYLHL